MIDKRKYEFAVPMCERLEMVNHYFLDIIMFSDEKSFTFQGKLTNTTAEFGALKCQMNILSMNATVQI
jgi:hypothetical protein